MFSMSLLFASLLATATAFAPLSVRSSRSALKMSFENEYGVLPPVGYWDPLGLANDIDEEKFNFYREVELKHGRVAMLAVTGYIVQESARFPGPLDGANLLFADIPNGVGAIGVVPSLGWLQLVASIGYWELIGWEDKKASSRPGDYGFAPAFFLKQLEDGDKEQFLTKEIQNGRLAMLGIMALLTHDIARPAGEGLFVLHHF